MIHGKFLPNDITVTSHKRHSVWNQRQIPFSNCVKAHTNENIKALHYWSFFVRGWTDDRWIPLTKGQLSRKRALLMASLLRTHCHGMQLKPRDEYTYTRQWTGSSLIRVITRHLFTTSLHFNQWWLNFFVNWTPRNIIQWDRYLNKKISFNGRLIF